ncbi:hypothetical protein N7520_010305 [Penicillium odoratum]|uniref:uncharacterized protein n=1 Tax=Penicillium odoratum TaxID=1167516 RepID=UPI0025496FE8|nr:uncharacterized protein N7520_010305 [Penicillium odoratum]KAJ5745123.1 hypothetical protein N7520_010305 [Penicillium odoratum]
MFYYFEVILANENSFYSSVGDQSVSNLALSRSGPIQWTTVDYSWHIQWPWDDDVTAGYAGPQHM